MSARTSLLKRFDELIDFGKTLSPSQSDLRYLARKQKWITSCQHILERTFGNESIYLKTYENLLNLGNQEAHITHGIALMEGAREEIEKGFLYKIEHLISADLFDSIIEQAEYLLKNGYKDVAAILGRVVVENTLKDIAKRENVNFPEDTKLAILNQILWQKGVYAKNVWRVIQAYVDLGNDAAHGHFEKYDQKSVQNMLNWIRETLLNL